MCLETVLLIFCPTLLYTITFSKPCVDGIQKVARFVALVTLGNLRSNERMITYLEISTCQEHILLRDPHRSPHFKTFLGGTLQVASTHILPDFALVEN